MALAGDYAAYNVAAKAAADAWDVLMDGLSPGDKLMIIPYDENLGSTSTNAIPLETAVRQVKTFVAIKRAANDGSNKFAIAGNYLHGLNLHTPMFWLCTNAAGDLT